MQVELRTLDGLVKERTHCAPNGYYFIPVYDKVRLLDGTELHVISDRLMFFPSFLISQQAYMSFGALRFMVYFNRLQIRRLVTLQDS